MQPVTKCPAIPTLGSVTLSPFGGRQLGKPPVLRRDVLVAPVIGVLDGLSWAIALLIATWLRFDMAADQIEVAGLAVTTAVAACAQLAFGFATGVYQGRHSVGSVEQALTLAAVTTCVGFTVFVGNAILAVQLVPRSVPLTAALIAAAIVIGLRLALRRSEELARRPSGPSVKRVIVLGAGSAGRQLIRSMFADGAGVFRPVALLDDDPRKRRLRVDGVPVRGASTDLARVAAAEGAEVLIVAAAGIAPADLKEVSRAAVSANLTVKVLPPLHEIFRSFVRVDDLRDLDIADLLGRRQIDTDVQAIAGYLKDRRVLVTGAGGSIGSELCRQIRRFGPAELMMLDRDESALHAVQLSIEGRALLDSPDVILADLRDRASIFEIFRARRPEVVFHAGALKHLPMLEQYPIEGWKTNVLGTRNILDAAAEVGVQRLVNISTDKAANPCSTLGRTKRIAERLVAHTATEVPGTYLSVRFGNVLGSRGSVLTTFAGQLAAGGPITITHPDVTRFFMTTAEAVQLVIQAGAIGRPGQALVLDMGTPVRIVDVARQLMEILGNVAPIVYTGLRAGEKLHEEMFGVGESDERPFHPAISHVAVPALAPAALAITGRTAIMRALLELAAELDLADSPIDAGPWPQPILAVRAVPAGPGRKV